MIIESSLEPPIFKDTRSPISRLTKIRSLSQSLLTAPFMSDITGSNNGEPTRTFTEDSPGYELIISGQASRHRLPILQRGFATVSYIDCDETLVGPMSIAWASNKFKISSPATDGQGVLADEIDVQFIDHVTNQILIPLQRQVCLSIAGTREP